MNTKTAVRIGAAALVLSSFLYGYVSKYEPRPRRVALTSGLTLIDTEGNPEATALVDGDGAYLVFLVSTGCRFCAETAPAWRALLDRTKGARRRGLSALVLSYSPPEPTSWFLAEHGLSEIPVLYLNADAVVALEAWSVPATIVVKGGADARFWDGVLSRADVESISRILQ